MLRFSLSKTNTQGKEVDEHGILVAKSMEVLKQHEPESRYQLMTRVLSAPIDKDIKQIIGEAYVNVCKRENGEAFLAKLRDHCYTAGNGLAAIFTVAGALTVSTTTLIVASVSKVTHDVFMNLDPRRSHKPIFTEIDKLAEQIAKIEDSLNQ